MTSNRKRHWNEATQEPRLPSRLFLTVSDGTIDRDRARVLHQRFVLAALRLEAFEATPATLRELDVEHMPDCRRAFLWNRVDGDLEEDPRHPARLRRNAKLVRATRDAERTGTPKPWTAEQAAALPWRIVLQLSETRLANTTSTIRDGTERGETAIVDGDGQGITEDADMVPTMFMPSILEAVEAMRQIAEGDAVDVVEAQGASVGIARDMLTHGIHPNDEIVVEMWNRTLGATSPRSCDDRGWICRFDGRDISLADMGRPVTHNPFVDGAVRMVMVGETDDRMTLRPWTGSTEPTDDPMTRLRLAAGEQTALARLAKLGRAPS